METMQLEELVYSALINNSTITGLLANSYKSVFHLQAPEIADTPYLVYSPISDVPVVHGDNLEKLHRVTFRIHIVTGKGDYSTLYSGIKNIMANLDFTRVQTTPFIDDGKKMLVTDFKIVTGG